MQAPLKRPCFHSKWRESTAQCCPAGQGFIGVGGRGGPVLIRVAEILGLQKPEHVLCYKVELKINPWRRWMLKTSRLSLASGLLGSVSLTLLTKAVLCLGTLLNSPGCPMLVSSRMWLQALAGSFVLQALLLHLGKVVSVSWCWQRGSAVDLPFGRRSDRLLIWIKGWQRT